MVKNKDIVKLSKGAESIVIAHKSMEIGKNYSISLEGHDYTFRKTPEGKIEMYVKSIS